MALSPTDPQSLEFSKYVYEELKHVRLIHFTLLVTAGAIAYTILANTTNADRLYTELITLQRLANGLNESNLHSDPSALPVIGGSYSSNFVDSLAKEFLQSKDVLPVVGNQFAIAVLIPCRFDGGTYLDSVKSRTVQFVRRTIEAGSWNFTRIASIAPINVTDLSSFSTFISEKHGDTLVKISDIEVFRPDSSAESQARMYGYGFVTLNLVHDRGSDVHRTIMPYSSNDILSRFTFELDSVRVPQDWFAVGFSETHKHWEVLKDKTFETALDWTASRKSDALIDKRLDIFGLSLESKYIAYVGSLVVMLLFAYIGAYVSQIHRRVRIRGQYTKTNVLGIAPWIGVMESKLIQGITFFTLSGSWFLGVTLTLWIIVRLPPLVWVTVTLLGAMAAACIIDTGSNLSKMYVNVTSVQTRRERNASKRHL